MSERRNPENSTPNDLIDEWEWPYLQTIYESLLKTLRTQAEDSAALNEYLEDARELDIGDFSDDEVFFKLTLSVFSAGFNWSTVMKYRDDLQRAFGEHEQTANYDEEDIQRLLSNDSLIRHERKIRATVDNAITFGHIVEEHGSFAAYLDGFRTTEETLDTVQERFDYVGSEVSREFLKEIGFTPIVKRDVHVRRIINRIGLVT
ncbi:MAG TPA: DNA-3-methyladenine glycosylase I [Halococcus sp.]|nr:DNA-3-methyladenine glycosylase I [Halococcus sp.]